ncbi:cysteine methyltransferase [Pedobacter yulinensis]|uniref:Cysteine methyltransferase n=1 Tax=Pedobacter yulinensis TaxID=2126353 RepID=A0A2T3HJV2_9SPHI|nr:MGMT family protein [Pedobacter yulinensis]PST82726.1 cysteine methyltransferase [Pedobacter yulinensis]
MKQKQADFFDQVYAVVQCIPAGRVSTYGAIARALGAARSSRLVGTALIMAHDPRLSIPVHRVVNRNGLLTGKQHYGSPSEMQERLEAEGIVVLEDQVQRFDQVFWDPGEHL